MKVLIVCSGNFPEPEKNFSIYQAFIHEQIEAVKRGDAGIAFAIYFIREKGVAGYLKSLRGLKERIRTERPDIIHAHNSTSALVAVLQRKVPVVCTFHGSDINLATTRLLSVIVQLLAKKLIFVSEALKRKAFLHLASKTEVVPCGVDTAVFYPGEPLAARTEIGLQAHKKYVLFSSSFSNTIKNYPLLKKSVELLDDQNLCVLELKDRTRKEVALLMNSANVCVLTSHSEGSPQFVKEALACGCPVISTEVGDVPELINDLENCYLTPPDPDKLSVLIAKVISSNKRCDGRERISRFDNRLIASKIISIYRNVLSN